MRRFLGGLILTAFLVFSCGTIFAQSKNFVAIKGSGKYHAPDCELVKNAKQDTQVYFEYPEDARRAGYNPCSVCKPQEHTRVIASKDANTYHLILCKVSAAMKPENIVKFYSPEEAVKAGYSKPCDICKPPKPVAK